MGRVEGGMLVSLSFLYASFQDIPFWKHATAGSAAGIMEHVAMYPLDTVKVCFWM